MPNMGAVVPVNLDLDSRFTFRCHKGIKCFTRCCSNIDILLTPYDVLRMKNRLGMPTGEFLTKYTYVQIDEKSSHPHAMLRMTDDKEKACPFVSAAGCAVYSDRPVSCRYYPLGQGALRKASDRGLEEEELYFFIREPHCFGYNEKKGWTVKLWRNDQGADVYDGMNREWKTIQLRRNIPGQAELDAGKQALFYMASYDLDRFRRFVFDSRFLEVFDLEPGTVENIRKDEIELMKFGFKYLKYILMLDKTLEAKDGVIEAFQRKGEDAGIGDPGH